MTESVKPGKRPPCATCGQPAFYLCDYPVAQRDGSPHRSCSRALCKKHATSVGFVGHYCPPHERMSRVPETPAGDRPRIPGFDP